jgi:ABC-type amino acid transport substrate-binding protein
MKNILVTILVAALISFGTYKVVSKDSHTETKTESAYERVMRTHVLHCGYNVWAPAVEKDANTGKIGGFIPEIVETAASAVGIKVEWTQQAGWGTFPQDIQVNRFDAMCAGAWATKELAPHLNFTRPLFFNPVYAYVRSDDHRFDADLQILNDAQYKIGSVDTAISEIIAKDNFPKAKIVGLPQLSDPSQAFEDLAQKKSDVVFMEGSFAKEYLAKNPDKIRMVNNVPVRSFPSPLMAASIDDARLTTMFDTIIGEMQLQGTIERILKKYNADPNLFILPNKPYGDKK